MFTFAFFVILAGLCWIGYDYFSSSKSGQAKIRSDFGFGGPFDEPGDSDGFGDEVVVGSIKTRSTTRRVIGWLGQGLVVAIDAYGEEFRGKIVHRAPCWRRENGGWALVQKTNCHRAVWCRIPASM